MQTRQYELNVGGFCITYQIIIMKKKLKALRCCSIYTSLALQREAQCEGHIRCFENRQAVTAVGALYPHDRTRGTSGVSLFLLNPQGANVYHTPKYEPIFSIILSVQRKPTSSSDT